MPANTLTAPQTQQPYIALSKTKFFQGYVAGLKRPSMRFLLTVPAVHTRYAESAHALNQLSTLLQHHLSTAQLPPPLAAVDNPLEHLKQIGHWQLHWCAEYLSFSGFHWLEANRLLDSRNKATEQITLLQPTPEGYDRFVNALFRAILKLLNHYLFEFFNNPAQIKTISMSDHTQEIEKVLGQYLPKGSNTLRLLSAAAQLNIPVQQLGGDIYQYGHGAHYRWFYSTITDQTPNLSTLLAKNKHFAQQRLKLAGLPVPEHAIARSEAHAVTIAQQLQYPVVVKPADLDGGMGVTAGIANELELRQAYLKVKKLSPHVLVEKHIHGRDYRLTVVNNAHIWTIERAPGSIEGDGIHTIAQLVAQLNSRPERIGGNRSPLQPIKIDDEAMFMLDKQALHQGSIPAPQQVVTLRRQANVSTGGTPKAVHHLVHPDNTELALRAAKAFNLDIAGIDLLIPDIAQSWRQGNAAICEINAQPQLGGLTRPQIYTDLLTQLMPHYGRIPSVMVLCSEQDLVSVATVVQTLSALNLTIGWSNPHGVYIAQELITCSPVNAFQAGCMLRSNASVQTMVLGVYDASIFEHGLPIDQYDHLVIALPQHTHSADEAKLYQQSIHALLPACQGEVYTLSPLPAVLQNFIAKSHTVQSFQTQSKRLLEQLQPLP